MTGDPNPFHRLACACPLDDPACIVIRDACRKVTEKSSFVLYYIALENNGHSISKAKRRYSEFESLRTALSTLYPALLIPPIPEKHTLSEYAYVQRRMTDEQPLIDKRKRLLQRFLQRLAAHPTLCREHILHLFLDPDILWANVLHSLTAANETHHECASNNGMTSANNATLVSFINDHLPSAAWPSANILPMTKSPPLSRIQDPSFCLSEHMTEKSAVRAATHFDRSQQRILQRLSGLSNDYTDLSTAYNNLSIHESSSMSAIMKAIAMTAKISGNKTEQLIKDLEVEFAEHVHEYNQYMQNGQHILQLHQMKQAQLEMIIESIGNKRRMHRGLMNIESNSKRLDTTLQVNEEESQSEPINHNGSIPPSHDYDDIDTHSIDDDYATIDMPTAQSDSKDTVEMPTYPSQASMAALRASRKISRKWSSPQKLLNAFSSTLQGIIDVDPEATRKTQISKLEKAIAQLVEEKEKMEEDLKKLASNIETEMALFKKQRSASLRAILIAYCKIHIEYCQQNVFSWEEARRQVDCLKDTTA
ncbi:uncharacterized protein BYT42DRAFT_349257 [Radiomyces spectabilis]|uniref:uncharacterized protein n=1 Tax=Radiomyces spectabilis TaxID=64574 RepID=UPI00221E5E88|nr:uncharacterized protein BYT42DRAFT_349257 [Radiomyces spectabilis]KAI8377580.1 hypothetical protein BYT42DRAFT_349257 [Radiomyces spectabilis]